MRIGMTSLTYEWNNVRRFSDEQASGRARRRTKHVQLLFETWSEIDHTCIYKLIASARPHQVLGVQKVAEVSDIAAVINWIRTFCLKFV
jgi:homoserine trans-succinylase